MEGRSNEYGRLGSDNERDPTNSYRWWLYSMATWYASSDADTWHTSWWKAESTIMEGWAMEAGATTDPNEVSQCYGVYTSYRKQRKSLYS